MAIFKWAVVDGTGSYIYDDSANWTLLSGSSGTGYPVAGDSATIEGPSAGFETIVGPGAAGSLFLAGGNLFQGTFATGLTEIDGSSPGMAVIGSGTLSASQELVVGAVNTGTLMIDAGAAVVTSGGSVQLDIGQSADAAGGVTVAAGGTLVMTGPAQSSTYAAVVGDQGDGGLHVMGSMRTGANGLAIAAGSTGRGEVDVQGGGTLVTGAASGASTDPAALAVGRDGVAGDLAVDGAGSEVIANGNMVVGGAGFGTLTLDDNAVLTVGTAQDGTQGTLSIGVGDATHIGGTGTAEVTNFATLDVAGPLLIGGNGVNGRVEISNYGTIIAHGYAEIGIATTIGGSLHAGSGTLELSYGELAMEGPATPGTAALAVGFSAGASGTVTVSNEEILLGANGLTVGEAGTGTVSIYSGGFIEASAGGTGDAAVMLGDQAGSIGTLQVSGENASLMAHGAIIVGNAGTGVLAADGHPAIGIYTMVDATDILVGSGGGQGTLAVSYASVIASGVLSVGANPASGAQGSGAGAVNVAASGEVDANTGTLFAGAIVTLATGTLTTTNGLQIEDKGEVLGYSGSIGGGVTDDGTIVSSVGTLAITGTIGGSGAVLVGNSADAIFGAGVLDGFDVSFKDNYARIDIDAPGSFGGTVGGFQAGDTIFAEGATSISYTGGDSITLFGSTGSEIGTIALAAPFTRGFVDNGGTITAAPCFVTGTLIDTEAGRVAVEALRIGDRIITASRDARTMKSRDTRAVKWIGRRGYDGRFIAGRGDMLPIRIHGGALGEHVPRRDLLVSPHHAMFLDGVLVPAEHLINGVSIVQEGAVDHVEYFHIELDTHDILLAEGAPAESFVDCDSRAMFQNEAEFAALYPETEAPRWQFCAERVEGGPILERIRARLAARAGIVATPGGALRGALDAVTRHELAGWAAGAEAEPVALVVSVDGAPVARVLACEYRADLAADGIFRGRHGFQVALPAALDPHAPHFVSLCRASDGAALPGSPVLLPALPSRPALPGAALHALLDAACTIGAHPRQSAGARSV